MSDLITPDNSSKDTVKGMMLAINTVLDTLGVDVFTGNRVLEGIEEMSKKYTDPEIQDGIRMVYDYIRNQMNIKIKELIIDEWHKWKKDNTEEPSTELGALHFHAYLEMNKTELLDLIDYDGDKYQQIKSWLREEKQI